MKLVPRFRFRLGLALVAAAFSVIPVFFLSGCQTAPITGRKQFILVGENTMAELGAEAYKQALTEAPVSQDRAANDLLHRVGMRIAEASGQSDYAWEFKVIQDDKTVNAWCLPGGKVAIYTGILKVTQDEAGLATVLGHEVAHATAHHGAERLTQQYLLKGGETALSIALQNREPAVVDGVMAAFGLGAQVGVALPFNRKQEAEADHIGLLYMARAGYDPEKAIEFWKRMAAMSGEQGTPEFLSTHPSHDVRIENLEKWLPEAKAEYRPMEGRPVPSSAKVPKPR